MTDSQALKRPTSPLFLVNRPLRESERVKILENVKAGGALVLGPENHDFFEDETNYVVPSPIDEVVSAK